MNTLGASCVEGISAIREKHAQWFEQNEVHAESAQGPFMGHEPDKFAVKFDV